MHACTVLTGASVLVVLPDPAPVGDGDLGVGVEEGVGAVGQRPVVHVVQLAVEVGAGGRAQVQVGPGGGKGKTFRLGIWNGNWEK